MKKPIIKNSVMQKTVSAPERKLVIISPRQREILALQTVLQPCYADGKCVEPTLHISKAVIVKWKNPFGKKCMLYLADHDDFSGAQKWEAFNSRKIYNLIPGKQYFLKVSCGKHCSETVNFSTYPWIPRCIYVPGVDNVRDLGGLSTSAGKKIRFGMIYRGAQHEKWVGASGITPEGKKILLEEFKLNTILDLRWWNEGKHVLEKKVRKYVKIPILAYATWHGPTAFSTGIFSEEQMDHVRKIFLLLAQKDSYPLYFHCQGGADRTGTIAFLLETILGVSQEDAEKDYECSNRLCSAEVWVRFMEKLNEYAPGKNIREKVSAYLYQCGIKEETLEKIRQILLNEE